MEALGRLTGGVAHEFNNLLTIVLGNASALNRAAQSRGDDRDARRAQVIESMARRGGRLAAQLLAYSQKQVLCPEVLSVYGVLSDVHELLARAAGDAVQMRLHADNDLWHCRVDPGELESAVLNMVLNARDAMPSGGTLSITCCNQSIEPDIAIKAGQHPGNYVRIDVADTGVGIPPDLLGRVFEPFFTTKPIGGGSGLGLAQVHGFARQSGGWTEIISTPGHGTTISMLLPRSAKTESTAIPPPVVPAATSEPKDTDWSSDANRIAESEQLHTELRDRSGGVRTRATTKHPVQRDPGADLPVPRSVSPTAIRIAVVPFSMMGSSPAQDISVGLAEELTSALSRFRWVSCISQASVAALSDVPLSNNARWGSLKLDYLLNGSFRLSGGKIRITIRLIHMRLLAELSWTRQFDGDLTDILRLQDEIAANVAAEIAPELLIWEGETATDRPQVDASSYELMLRAIPAIYRLDQTGFRAAGPLLKKALALSPSNAAAHSWLAHWYLLLIGQGWADNTKRAAQLAYEYAQRAVTLDPGDARGLTVAGHVEAFLRKRPVVALQLHAKALDHNPNLAIAWCYSGLANSYIGRHAEAIEQIRRAQELSPHDPHRFFFDMSMVMPLLLTGDYENAAQIGRRAREANPDLSSVYKGLISTLGLMGRTDEARTLRRDLARLEPCFSVQDAIERSPLTRHEDLQQYANGLRLAGCEERVHSRWLQEYWRPVATWAAVRALRQLVKMAKTTKE